jgi:hypothetical protein
MTIPFPSTENIWELTQPFIPTMYISGSSYAFERPANIQVNLEQQIQLSNDIFFVLKPGNIFNSF